MQQFDICQKSPTFFLSRRNECFISWHNRTYMVQGRLCCLDRVVIYILTRTKFNPIISLNTKNTFEHQNYSNISYNWMIRRIKQIFSLKKFKGVVYQNYILKSLRNAKLCCSNAHQICARIVLSIISMWAKHWRQRCSVSFLRSYPPWRRIAEQRISYIRASSCLHSLDISKFTIYTPLNDFINRTAAYYILVQSVFSLLANAQNEIFLLKG